MGKKIWIIIAVALLLVSGLVLGGGGMLLSGVPAAFVIAETLQQSESLGTGAYTVSWWLAWIGLALVLLLCGVRIVRKRRGATVRLPMLPLWIYGGLHLACAWGLGLLEFAPLADVPAWPMAYVLLTVDLYISWVFPLLLLGLLIRALWRWAKASWNEDGRGAQIAGALLGGALLCSVVGSVGLFVEGGYQFAGFQEADDAGRWFSPTAARESHLWMASAMVAAHTPEPYVANPLSGRRRMTFGACSEEIFRDGALSRCARRAVKRGVPGQKDDIARDTMLKVCEKVARDGVEELAPYYGRACENAITDALKRSRPPPIDAATDPVDWLRPQSEPSANNIDAALDCIDRIGNALDPKQRRTLELSKLGHPPKQIATLLGEFPNTVSQRLSRLKRMLRKECRSAYRSPVRGWGR